MGSEDRIREALFDVHGLRPGRYYVSCNGELLGTIMVRGVTSDGVDLIQLLKTRHLKTGDTIEYMRVPGTQVKTPCRRFARIKNYVNEGLGCLLSEDDIAWLVKRIEDLEGQK
jgi:hypothetical protein